MTTMDYTTTIRALKRMKVETGGIICLGCGYEHGCSAHGCAILHSAVEHMEAAQANYDHLSALVDQRDADIEFYAKCLADSEEARTALARHLASAQSELAKATVLA